MARDINTPIRYLKGVGPKKAGSLNSLGIKSAEEVLYHFPCRYEDRTNFLPISQLKKDQTQTIKGKILVKNQRQSRRRRNFNILEVVIGDQTGKVFCVWFNQPYLKEYFKTGQELVLYGRVQEYLGRLQMNTPEFEIISKEGLDCLDIGRIVPIYSLPEGITQRYFRRLVKACIDECIPRIKDILPYSIRTKYNLLNSAKSLINIHFPETFELQKEAYRRLSFEEFFLFQIPMAMRRLQKKQRRGIVHKVDGPLVDRFISGLPFELTLSQRRVISEIKNDMAQEKQMQRLLQGDVGCGKTIVATIACVIAVQSGYQAAFMVPTEILARQHYNNIKYQISNMGNTPNKTRIGMLIGSINKKEKEKICRDIQEGKVDIVIGTHALLEETVKFKNLGLAIIDEQHKFGVAQRTILPQKADAADMLIMTATPIPRTLAITLYGDMDISVIGELPALRKPVETRLWEEGQREEAYKFMEERILQGRQVYIVYPIIEESFDTDIKAAGEMFEKLKTEIFPNFRIGLVHGRLKNKEQERVMSEFTAGRIHILVATTVLEVGVDVPNASVMVIEHADRFGLSQLHQLRGRVGRGPYPSYCILFASARSEEARLRLTAIVENHDGFRIAEEDLKIRGPGEFFGKRQHGLSELKVANPLRQIKLLKAARQEAIRIVGGDPDLSEKNNSYICEALNKRFPGYNRFLAG